MIGFERRWNPLLTSEVEAFVDAVGGSAPPKPAAMDAIMACNRGLAP